MPSQKQEKLFLIIFVIITCVLGISPALDSYFAGLFYHPEHPIHPWFEKDFMLWRFFYHAAPIISAGLLLPAIILYVGSFVSRSLSKFRADSLYVFLGFLIGPGILINSIFKPYWGRPRPREVLDFGGFEGMQSFWELGVSGNGYSFPCGHSSVGFALILGYYLFKMKKPKLAMGFLLGSFFFGTLMGIGRMADGAHFFTDVLWSAVMTFVPAYYLNYRFRVRQTVGEFKKNMKLAFLQGGVLLVALVAAVLLATPYKQSFSVLKQDKRIHLQVGKGNFEFKKVASLPEDSVVQIQVKSRGFGFPDSKLVFLDREDVLKVQVEGFFTDFEAIYLIKYTDALAEFQLELNQYGKVRKIAAEDNSKFVFKGEIQTAP